MVIAENGPLLHQADEILERAMNSYWKKSTKDGKWHFVRTKQVVRSYTGCASCRKNA